MLISWSIFHNIFSFFRSQFVKNIYCSAYNFNVIVVWILSSVLSVRLMSETLYGSVSLISYARRRWAAEGGCGGCFPPRKFWKLGSISLHLRPKFRLWHGRPNTILRGHGHFFWLPKQIPAASLIADAEISVTTTIRKWTWSHFWKISAPEMRVQFKLNA